MENNGNLITILKKITARYPPDMKSGQLRDVPRIAFNIGIGLQALNRSEPAGLDICDIGGGVGLFSIGCATYGFKRTVLVDDFDDPVNHEVGDAILDLHRASGVEIISSDVVLNGIRDIAGQFDIITTFDSMEHWHHSPKKLFQDIVKKLKPGGVFVLGVPNCVNLRKRISVPLGLGKWSEMSDWYETEFFRGHVREPDISDLSYIARDMNLVNVKIYGRNWLGYYSTSKAVRTATAILDHPLRLKPSLCSDIYMVAMKS